MKIIHRVILVIMLACSMMFIIKLFDVSKTEAISPPLQDPVIEYWKVFRSVHETNDMILVCRYFLNYAYEPPESAGDAFFLCLKDSTGKFVVQRSLPVDGYGYNIQCVYLSAADVVSLGITWGGEYDMVVTSSPTLFSSVYEGEKFLDFGSWIDASSVTDGKSHFRDCVITQSKYLEKITALSLITSTSTGDKLNVAGRNWWQLRYSGINDIPNLSVTSTMYLTTENQTFTGSYLDKLDAAETGTSMFGSMTVVKDSFTTLGDTIGIPYWQVIAFLVLCLPAFMIIAGTVYGVSGNSKMAVIIAAPMMFVITMLVPDALLMVLTAIIAFIVVAVMWRFV